MGMSREKSTLPFLIFATLATLGADTATPTSIERGVRLTRHLGTIFWLLDDLVDLHADYHSGQVNAIVASSRPAPDRSTTNNRETTVGTAGLDRRLVRKHIDTSAAIIVNELENIARLARMREPGTLRQLHRVVLCYVCDAVI